MKIVKTAGLAVGVAGLASLGIVVIAGRVAMAVLPLVMVWWLVTR